MPPKQLLWRSLSCQALWSIIWIPFSQWLRFIWHSWVLSSENTPVFKCHLYPREPLTYISNSIFSSEFQICALISPLTAVLGCLLGVADIMCPKENSYFPHSKPFLSWFLLSLSMAFPSTLLPAQDLKVSLNSQFFPCTATLWWFWVQHVSGIQFVSKSSFPHSSSKFFPPCWVPSHNSFFSFNFSLQIF